jgi:hypothetical protein
LDELDHDFVEGIVLVAGDHVRGTRHVDDLDVRDQLPELAHAVCATVASGEPDRHGLGGAALSRVGKCDNREMGNEFDDLFADHARQAGASAARDVDEAVDQRRVEFGRWLDQLTVTLQPIADAAVANGHRASLTRDNDRNVEFEISFKEHPDLPVSCSFVAIYPPGGQVVVFVDSDGPGKLDDPRDPVRRPLDGFTMDTAQRYVTDMIRSASKLLP